MPKAEPGTAGIKAIFDVFLSYNRADLEQVELLAKRLKVVGIRPWLDLWEVVPGTAWQDEIEKTLADCRSVAVVLGPHDLGRWQREEMHLAIARRVENTGGRFCVVPVLLPNCDREKIDVPLLLTRLAWVEFKELDDQMAFHRLVCGIRGVPPGDHSPYEGQEGQTRYYFILEGSLDSVGTTQIAALLDILRTYAQDANLTIKKVSHGSIRLLLEGSVIGLERLRFLHQTGRLASVLDLGVRDVIAPHYDVKTAMPAIVELEAHAPAQAFENLLTLLYTFPDFVRPAVIEEVRQWWRAKSSKAGLFSVFSVLSETVLDVLLKWDNDVAPKRQNGELSIVAINALAERRLWPGQAAAILFDNLRSKNPELRRAAASTLATLNLPAEIAIPIWVASLSDDDFSVFEMAVNSLAAFAGAAIPAVVACLESEQKVVRHGASEVLRRIGDRHPHVCNALIHDLESVSRDIRARAAEALAQMRVNVPVVREALTRAIQDADPDVRCHSAEAFGLIGAKMEALTPLLKAANDEEPIVRTAAAQALGTLGGQSWRAVETLIQLLNDRELTVREAALDSLIMAGSAAASAVPATVSLLESPQPQLRARAATLLVLIARVDAFALIELVLHQDQVIRRSGAEAIRALTMGDTGRAIGSLMELLKNGDAEVRQGAGMTLLKIGGPAVPVLVRALLDERTYVRFLAASLLGQMGPAAYSSAGALLEASRDTSPDVRTAATIAFARIQPQAPESGRSVSA